MFRKLLISSFLACTSIGVAQEFVSDSLLVKFKDGTEVPAAAANLTFGARVNKFISGAELSVLKLPAGRTVPQALTYYRGLDCVQYAEPNYKFKLHHTPNDPQFGQQYQFIQAKFPEAWDLWKGSTNTVVAVIDTGCDLTHPDLQSKLVSGFDFSDNDSDPSDGDGHGTHCCGNVGAATNNAIGVAGGAYNCKVMPLKIFPNATSDVIIAAWRWGADNGAKVFSMSFGRGGGPSQAEQDALNYAKGKGVVHVVSAGNNNSSTLGYPQLYSGVLVVGATNSQDQKAGFSNWGPGVHVAAGGDNQLSTMIGGYTRMGGTSMSCPVVAGLAGLMVSRGPNLTPDQIIARIKSTCDPVGNWVVHGRINAFKAMQQVAPPVTNTYNALTVTRYYGGAMLGGIAQVQSSDNSYAMINSAPSTVGAMAGAYTTYRMTGDRSKMLSLSVSVEARGAANSTGMLYLWNWTTLKYEYVAAFGVKLTDATTNVLVNNATKYMDSSGNVKAILRAHVPKRFGSSPFPFAIDMTRLSGTFRQ